MRKVDLQRQGRISYITGILRTYNNNPEFKFNKKTFILEIMDNYGCSKRTAMEYISVAENKINKGSDLKEIDREIKNIVHGDVNYDKEMS